MCRIQQVDKMEKSSKQSFEDMDYASDSSYDFTDKPPSYSDTSQVPIREKPSQADKSQSSLEANKRKAPLFKRLLPCFVDTEHNVDHEAAIPANKPRLISQPDATDAKAAVPHKVYMNAVTYSSGTNLLQSLIDTELGSPGDPWYRNPDQQYYNDSMRGWFSNSSKSMMLVTPPGSGVNLVAECCTISGTRKVSMICLDDIISNCYGHFKWVGPGTQGKFSLSAKAIRLEDGGRLLVAELGRGDGICRRDTLRLDEMITNIDGKLVALHHQ